MANEGRRNFESRHVKEILGIDKDRLHHWTQNKKLIIPVVQGRGRGGRNQFSFENLLELDVIKELEYYGLDLNAIGKIMRSLRNFKQAWYKTGKPTSLWAYIRTNRKHYEKKGGFLALFPEAAKKFYARLITNIELAEYISEYRGAILIGILAMIKRMEEKTGIQL